MCQTRARPAHSARTTESSPRTKFRLQARKVWSNSGWGTASGQARRSRWGLSAKAGIWACRARTAAAGRPGMTLSLPAFQQGGQGGRLVAEQGDQAILGLGTQALAVYLSPFRGGLVGHAGLTHQPPGGGGEAGVEEPFGPTSRRAAHDR